jgi:hypothetical protein
VSFADALARLVADDLTALLTARPDVLVEPAPRTFEQLAQRLGGAESLSAALATCDRDMLFVGQAVALSGPAPTTSAVMAFLRSPEPLVVATLDRLCARGLAWREGDFVRLPERLAEHLAAPVTLFRPVAAIAKQTVVDDLRVAVRALGGAVDGLRKPELVARLVELLSEPDRVARAISGLSRSDRARLDRLRVGAVDFVGWSPRSGDPDAALVNAGLLLGSYGSRELPREVAYAALIAERPVALTGPPALAPAGPVESNLGRSAAEDLLRGVTALLDEARAAAIAGLKKGGVGSRERAWLAKRLDATPEEVGLWIDLPAAAGLLAAAGARYAPTGAYDTWREARAAQRWAALALGWWQLDFAPTYRVVDDDTEAPPPVPLVSDAGTIRRAVLRAAAGGRSVRAAAEHVDWFCPVTNYDAEAVAVRVAAALREAESLGVLAGDRLTELGEQLVAGGDDLGARCAAQLPEARGMLVLQSDLTALVSGQPSVAVSRLLAGAAVPEARGVATTWRFTPASVRAALDAGWTPDGLREELREISDRPLPQPLDYLITDVARRHGTVRVRGMRSCVIGPESEIAEIMHTRSLRKLHLAALAPTVLSSPFELDEVLARLRDAGFAPLAEDAEGVVIVEEKREERALDTVRRARARVTAAELARRLRDNPPGADEPRSPTYAALAGLTTTLDAAELALLADAIDHQRDVSIVYRDKTGSVTVRDIQPREVYGPWLESWCHLKNAQREFTVANIQAVAPAG